MKRYRFNLAAVLRARRAQESLARATLVAANTSAHAAESAARQSLAHYEQVLRLTGLGEQGFMASRQRASLAAKSFLDAKASSEQAKAAAEAATMRYLGARRAVAVLERLEARRRAEHARAVQHEEALLADELAVGRHRGRALAGKRN